MLSELVKKEYNVKQSFIELETTDFEGIKKALQDNVWDCFAGRILLTRVKFRGFTPTSEDDLERVIKKLRVLVYKISLEEHRALVVYFEGDYSNEIINKHNEKVLAFIEKLNKVNNELAIRSEKVLANEKDEKRMLYSVSLSPEIYTVRLEKILNELLSKEKYLLGKLPDNRMNLELYTESAFTNSEWSLSKKKELIRSLFLELPIGTIHINKFAEYFQVYTDPKYKKYGHLDSIIYDGKQRLTAILSFLMGEFSVDFDNIEYTAGNLSDLTLKHILLQDVTICETSIESKKNLLTRYKNLHRY